jgi:hypothetical protein
MVVMPPVLSVKYGQSVGVANAMRIAFVLIEIELVFELNYWNSRTSYKIGLHSFEYS